MKLNLIKAEAEAYKKALIQNDYTPSFLFRKCVKAWHDHFDLEELDMAPILEKALKNEESGRLWGGEQHSIKSGLLLLARHNRDLFWTALKDLLKEEKMLVMRVDRYLHHCDVIFKDIRKANQKLTTHYQNHYSAALLLSLQYPQNYCLFDYSVFEKFAEKIEVSEIPINTDLERYYKILRAIYSVVAKDEQLMQAYYENLPSGVYFGPSLDVIHQLMHFSCQNT